jgi:hypothetical protein
MQSWQPDKVTASHAHGQSLWLVVLFVPEPRSSNGPLFLDWGIDRHWSDRCRHRKGPRSDAFEYPRDSGHDPSAAQPFGQILARKPSADRIRREIPCSARRRYLAIRGHLAVVRVLADRVLPMPGPVQIGSQPNPRRQNTAREDTEWFSQTMAYRKSGRCSSRRLRPAAEHVALTPTALLNLMSMHLGLAAWTSGMARRPPPQSWTAA